MAYGLQLPRRSLDFEKTEGLRQTKGNFSSEITLSVYLREELQW